MPQNPIQFAGVIRFQSPLIGDGLPGACDDSTLASLLYSFTHRATLAENREIGMSRFSLPTSQRFSWLCAANTQAAVSANLNRLLADLQSEFDQRNLAP
jgi:hypothetical protein